MTPPTKPDMLSEAQREREKRAQTYREKALKIFPWICGSRLAENLRCS